MVAVTAEMLDEHFVSEELAEVLPFPSPSLWAPALRCWLVSEEGEERGDALDVSKAGACVRGLRPGRAVGERLSCKLELHDGEPPLYVRCKIVSVTEGELGLRFLELGFDAWYRLGRVAAGGGAPARPSNVLMPPA